MTRLEAKVNAVNEANAKANQLYKLLAPLVQSWEGQDILKIDGTLKKKYEGQLPPLEYGPVVRVYKRFTTYAVSFTVTVSVNSDDCSMYHEATCYLARMQNGVVGPLSDATNLRTDYKAEEVTRLRAVAEEAERVARDAEYALSPFGKYDR